MKKVKKEKGCLVVGLLLGVMLTIVAFRFSHLYAANQVEVSKKCSLTLQLPDNSEYCTELENVSLEAKVYRIASIDENGVCASVSGYESLDLEKYGQDSKNYSRTRTGNRRRVKNRVISCYGRRCSYRFA